LDQKTAWTALGAPQRAQHVGLFSSGLHRHVPALSWVHEDFSWLQTAPPACYILVLVDPPLLYRECLFFRYSPCSFCS